jgi:hypothetical protein
VIFMGDGNKSKQHCEELHHRLDEALSIIGGLQQGGEPFEGHDMQRVYNIAAIIVNDLTGEEFGATPQWGICLANKELKELPW